MCFSLQRRAIFPHRNFKKWSEHVARGAFWLKMCFSPQRRAIFPHRNFKKWSETVSFLRFWLEHVLLATAACNFSTSQLQKVVRTCSESRILLENVLLATAACNFSTSQLQKVVRECCVLYILTCKCASRYSGVQFFISELKGHLRTHRFNEVTFRPSRPTNHWKTQHFATSLTFRACWSSFFPHLLIFFLAALLFQLSILSEVRLLNFLWQSWLKWIAFPFLWNMYMSSCGDSSFHIIFNCHTLKLPGTPNASLGFSLDLASVSGVSPGLLVLFLFLVDWGGKWPRNRALPRGRISW